jgi:hypothetical protein
MNFSPLTKMAYQAPASVKQLIRSLRHGVSSRPSSGAHEKQDEWSIGIYRGRSPFSFTVADSAHDPVLTRRHVVDVPARYVADPFMLRVNGTWNLFFEVMNARSGKGEIGLAMSQDGLRWNYQQIVLDEPFHLSYPYVFHWQNEFFMVPETFRTNSVRLYRADPFPSRWSFVTTLIAGKEYVDSSLARFKDTWWLFTGLGEPPFRADRLHLFAADHLLGPWREHPKSPVVNGNAQVARPAGRILFFEDRLIRYTQDCALTYGRQVRAFEITDLTLDTYSERLASEEPVLSPRSNGWSDIGMHHLDPHLLDDGSWLACVDGWRWAGKGE